MKTNRDTAAGGDGPLPAVDSGVIGGSTGGASMSELRRGFTRLGEDEEMGEDDCCEGEMPMLEPEPPHQGFLDRPQGWER